MLAWRSIRSEAAAGPPAGAPHTDMEIEPSVGLIWLLPSPTMIGLLLLVGLAALIPTRRLWQAGLGPRALLTYLAGLIGLACLAVEFRGLERYLAPLAALAWTAPFVLPATLLGRLFGPSPRRPPPRNVTPRG